jgi:hypothetical protein
MAGLSRTSPLSPRVKPGKREGRRSSHFGRGVTPKAQLERFD